MSFNDSSNRKSHRISRRRFLKTSSAAIAGGFALASGLNLSAPRVARAQGIKGTKLTIFWQEPSIPESLETQKKNMEDWAAANGVELTLESVALGEWAAKLATMAEAKGGADLVNMYAMDVAVNAPVMSDISDLADELDKKLGGWYDGPKSVCIQDGKWKAVPAAIYGQYWIYRTDLFKEVGAEKWPETWQEFHQVGKKLKEKGTPIGFTLGPAVTDGATHCYSLLWSFGGKEFEADGKTIALDSPETLACLEFFQSFYKDALAEDSFSWNESGNNQAFLSGKVAATNNANTIYAGLQKNAPDLVGKASHGNTLKGPAGAFQYMSMQYWGIPTYAQNVEAAKAYLRDSFYDTKFQTAWTKAGNGYNLPPFPALDKIDEAWPTDPNLASARTLAKTTRMPGAPGPFTPAVGQSMNKFLIINMFAKVAQGTAPKDAIKATVDEMNAILTSQK
ncbi:MAG: extracellular solute-binding protein [Anaerolineae bacterium]|nr:extracellular solute-binding protein [Anaerolineae bacterium]